MVRAAYHSIVRIELLSRPARCLPTVAEAAGRDSQASGDEGARTLNPCLAKAVLSQLSYVPGSITSLADEAGLPIGLRARASGRTWIRTKDLSFIRAAL